MRHEILGPMRVIEDGQPVDLGPHQMRVLLAVLQCRANQTVATQELIASIWGQSPPKSAAKNLQVYVYRLRMVLGRDRITHHRHGYRLALGPEELDALAFRALVARAVEAADDPALAAKLLTQALDLWRGAVFEDLGPVPALGEPVAQLNEERLVALEARTDLDLAQARSDAVAIELGPVVEQNPLRQRLREQYMVALFRCGRTKEALDTYARFRHLFAEELGLEPPGRLKLAQRAILRGEDPWAQAPATPARAVPAQLPPPITGFVGRADHQRALDDLLHGPAATAVISSISGLAGIGKTALAVQWAHRTAGRFPDGQLYINLRGYSPDPPMPPMDALGQFLRALGVPPNQVPITVQEASAAYRTAMADRRMLVVLDNARDAQQVRPLLAATPGSLTLVTSRARLGGLVAIEGARTLVLDVLPEADSIALLAGIAGEQRISGDLDAAADLARACGHLPLALRIAAARLVLDPALSVAQLAADLRAGERLSALSIDDDPLACVRAAFDTSYRCLIPEQGRALRRMGLAPGVDFTAAALAELLASDVDEARSILNELAERHLIEPTAAGRYALHDLVRDYAIERAGQEETEAGRSAALQRLLAWRLRMTHAAAAVAAPHPIQLPLPDRYQPPIVVAEPAEAQAWWNDEKSNLLATVHYALDDDPELACLLTDSLRGFFYSNGNTTLWMTTTRAALTAAERMPADGRDRVRAALQIGYGLAYYLAGDTATALENYRAARPHAVAGGWLGGQAAIELNIGVIAWHTGDPDTAIGHLTTAGDMAHRDGLPTMEVMAYGNLAIIARQSGRFQEAGERYHAIIPALQKAGSRMLLALTYLNLVNIDRILGRFEQAREHAEKGIRIYEELDNRTERAGAYAALADVYNEMGQHEIALKTANAGLDILHDQVYPIGEVACLLSAAAARRGLGAPALAREAADRALALAVELDSANCVVLARTSLAEVHRELRDHATARDHAQVALDTARRFKLGSGEAGALASLARIALAAGEPASAVELAGQAIGLEDIPAHRTLLDRARRAAPR